MGSLIEGLMGEMSRNRELMREYDAIGPMGRFGALMIKRDIEDAEKAVAEGDVVQELKMFEKLRGNK